MSKKIIQIIPAPSNLHAAYSVDGKERIKPVACLALTDTGEVLPMVVYGAEIEVCNDEYTALRRLGWIKE